MDKILWIIRGLPGSGKSTFARKLVDLKYAFEYYEADMFFTFFNKNHEYKFDVDMLHLAHEWCETMVSGAMASNKSVVVSNTFVTANTMDTYIYNAHFYEFTPRIITMKNNYGSIHDVPSSVMESMRKRFDYSAYECYNDTSFIL